MKYKSDFNAIEFKNRLNDLIENQSDDKFLNHFGNIITKQTQVTSGKVYSNYFVIWHYDILWSGMFYSVNVGKIIDNGENCFIELYSKLNRFALILVTVISFIIGYVIFTEIIIQKDNSFKFLLWRSLIGLILFSLFQTVPIITYFDSKKNTVKMLTEKLQLKNVC